jgi:hypothetical protein
MRLSKGKQAVIIGIGAAVVFTVFYLTPWGQSIANYIVLDKPAQVKVKQESRVVKKLEKGTIDALVEFFGNSGEGGREAVIDCMVQAVPYPQNEHVSPGLLLTDDGLILTTDYATTGSNGIDYENIFVIIDGKSAKAELVAHDPINRISLIYCPTGKKAGASRISLYRGDIAVGQKAEAIFGYGDRMYWRKAEIAQTELADIGSGFFRLKQENPSEKVSGGYITIDDKLAGIIISEYTEKKGVIVQERSILATGMDTVKKLADLLIEYSRQ